MTTDLRPMTLDEFAKYADDGRYEFVDGEMVRRAMGIFSSSVGGYIHHLLTVYCQQPGRGRPLPDNVCFRCFSDDPSRIRKPDVSWFSGDRWSPSYYKKAHAELAPDLIVEVVSPGDKAAYVNRKVQHFFAAGTKEAWIVYPEDRQVERRYTDGSGRWYSAEEEIDAASLLPGFRWRLAEVLANI